MKAIQLESRVGDDGVLSLQVPLGPAEARSRVIVTISPFLRQSQSVDQENSDWKEFISRTYGSCDGLGLEEPEDLPLPQVDPSE
jgi:hypothetical protein